MPSSKRPALVRAAILGASAELIRQQGVAGTSIADVVAASGTSAGAIYHHFGSKEQLVLAVGRAAMAVPLQLIEERAGGLSPIELMAAALGRVAQDRAIPELLLQIWAGAKADSALHQALVGELSAVKTGIASLINDWCDDHDYDADPSTVTSLILSMVTGFGVLQALGVDDGERSGDLANGLLQLLNGAALAAAAPASRPSGLSASFKSWTAAVGE